MGVGLEVGQENGRKNCPRLLMCYIPHSLCPYNLQDNKADVILKYNADEARSLKAYGELPEHGECA